LYFIFSNTSFCQQNLVYNGDFEEYSSCPDNISVPSEIPYQIEKCIGWTAPTYGTSDYFNECAMDFFLSGQVFQPPFSAICQTCFGCQPSFNGKGYLGFGAASYSGGSGSDGYNGIMWWEYVSGKLIEPLIAGEKYKYSMEISLSEVSDLMVSEIGVYISKNEVHTLNTASLNLEPQLIFLDSNFFNDTVNWIHLETEFLADGGEQFITIGNFKDNITTDTLRRIPINMGQMSTYIFVDDVRIEKVIEIDSINSKPISNVFTPNNDGINDVWIFPSSFENEKISILNRWGNLVFESSISPNFWNGKDSNGNICKEGTYFYKTSNSNKSGFIQLVR
jgi:gliding motility-associated-like protein